MFFFLMLVFQILVSCFSLRWYVLVIVVVEIVVVAPLNVRTVVPLLCGSLPRIVDDSITSLPVILIYL